MKSPISELVKKRYSCRTYIDRPIEDADREALAEFLGSLKTGPFGGRVRFALVAATGEDRAALKGLGTYGFIKDAPGFLVGTVEQSPKNLEDYGYALECAVLAATDLGLQTCWLGGTFNKSTFARKVGATNASPEPVRKGRTVKVTAKVTAKFTDKKYRSVPAGVGFTVQFKASGAKKYKAVASGLTVTGRATAKVKATKSGRYRVVVGSKKSGSDYVRVKK